VKKKKKSSKRYTW